MTVSDDGRGAREASGEGLTGLRGRVADAGGVLTVEDRPGGGVTLRAEMSRP
ncbi:MAG: hypothetical protein ACK5LS_12980 [Propioniciclava sp.]